MTNSGAANVTRLLARWNAGDPDAVEDLLPLVYDELRRLARSYLRKERAEHTLQPTALVHEAYVRLAERVNPPWQDRVHFYAVVAKVMRRVLVDHARSRGALKRGGQVIKVPIDETRVADMKGADILALDEAMDRLEAMDPRKARIIDLRFFGGLTIEETAGVLEVSSPTVINETRKARAWLYAEIFGGSSSES